MAIAFRNTGKDCFHKIVEDDHGNYFIALHALLLIPISNVLGLSECTFIRSCTGKIRDGVATSLNDEVKDHWFL